MPVANIDTFEHDISEEIKTKEATIGDIASASGDISNTPVRSSSGSTLLIALGIIFFLIVIVIAAIFFIRLSQQPLPATPAGNTVQLSRKTGIGDVSYSIEQAVGTSIGSVQKSEYGYTIDIISYPDVFAFMLKNEQSYADELARAVGSPRDTSTTTPLFSFTDMTVNNQNMRVGTSASSTIVYAFVNTKTLLVASSVQNILALRSAILH